MRKTNWLGRNLIVGPYLTLVLSEAEFFAAMKDCHVERAKAGKWIKTDHSHATMHFLENPKQELCCIVAISSMEGRTPVEIAGLLIHEAVHVWQQFCERIGETHPSDEFEAYSIQVISQQLLQAYADRIAK